MKNIPCEKCGSKDNAALYSSGWAKCHTPGCNRNWRPEGDYDEMPEERVDMDMPPIEGEYQALVARGISEDVCKRYRYQVGVVPKDYPVKSDSAIGRMKGKTVQIANFFREDGTLVGQILRDKDKNFAVIGQVSDLFFGRHCAKAGGKVLVVTEGFIDAMSYTEMRRGWYAVSIPNGGGSAAKTFKKNLQYLESFEKVIVCFDNDDAGREAVESVKGILSPGKMWIANLPQEFKDMNKALQEGAYKAAMQAVMDAELVFPDGLVDVDDVLAEALKPIEIGLPWFLPELTELTYGRRFCEVYTLGAGTGVGKTDLLTEQVAFDVTQLGLHVGVLFLEQKPAETLKRVAGKVASKRFHVPDAGWTQDELVAAAQRLRGKITFYDSFGQTEWSSVKSMIRHMAIADGIKVFYLDHLTAMADTSDEKGSLEQIMKEIAGLANELRLIIHLVSHLTTPDGTPHEEGGRVMIRHFKGSRAIGFWSYLMIGLERDQQSEDPNERHQTILRVLKDRYTGQATGHIMILGYDANTGRIIAPSATGFPPPPDQLKEGF